MEYTIGNIKKSSIYRTTHHFFWKDPNRLTAAKVAITIVLIAFPFILLHIPYIGISLSLGIVAAALSETDDHPKGRLKALIITILSFATTTFSVSLLKPFPIVFGIGFIASTIIFVLIGGISERYRGISYGAILIGIYAMLGYDKNFDWYLQPVFLCIGALSYGLLSLFLLYRKPERLIEEQLARGFIALSAYLEGKSKLFTISDDNATDKNNRLAILNVQMVSALEKCKEVLNIYSQEVNDHQILKPYLQRFMLLQSLHERAASSHERYEVLNKKDEYKELLEGFAELLNQLSSATKLVAEKMLTSQTYNHPISIGWIVSALEFEIEKLPQHDRQLLELLLHNLSRSHLSLSKLNSPEESTSIPRLGQDKRSTWERIKDQLHWSHPRLRYAIRLSACFLIGYSIISYFEMEKGEWIMLTSLFVSQPTYSETRRRLFQRILGTITGVLVGILLLHLLPTLYGQILLILSSSFLFFYFLRTRYSNAVIFITIYVLAANNITHHSGIEVLVPRLYDTISGALLAFIAIRFLWPNWQYKQLNRLLSDSLINNGKYLGEIWNEYINKKEGEDDYEYRLARRLAHKSDNALTLSWQSMQVEPKSRKKLMEQAFTLTYLNHVLISHLSAFGAQREEFSVSPVEYQNVIDKILISLTEASNRLNNKNSEPVKSILKPILIELKELIDNQPDKQKKQQLRLLYNIAGVSNKLLRESDILSSKMLKN